MLPCKTPPLRKSFLFLSLHADTLNRWIIESSGELTYSNRAWGEQMGIEGAKLGVYEWTNGVSEDSRAEFAKAWEKLTRDKVPQVFEARLANPWSTVDLLNGGTVVRDRWILCSAFPEVTNEGSLKAVWGCNTDISHQKWAESLKEQRLHDVLEAKRQSVSMQRYFSLYLD